MTDYKLVPFDPTPEMVSAAEDAYMPFGDMELAIRMALLAAPAVQGEPSRESSMVVLERDEYGKPAVWCDPEIADLVSALNEAGIRTVASCSGHGHRPGNIMLADGRELVIARDFDEARKVDAMFPGINGEPPAVQEEPVVTDEMIEAVQRIRETAMRQSVVARIPECGEFSGIAQDAGWLLYALRTAEHRPCPENIREGAPYDDPAFESLCREHEIWGTAAAALCAVFWEAGKRADEQQPELAKYQPCGCVVCTCEHETQCQGCGAHHCGTHPVGQIPGPVYQQPAPDVKALVEALEQGFPLLIDEGLDEVEHHCEWAIQRERKRVHSILAARRKQEPGHD